MKLLKLRPKEGETLSVVPVARYRDPKYPSFEDPDPTKVPERVPFPFRREVSIALAAAAIGCLDEASAIPVPAAPKPPEKSTQQPPVEVPKEIPPPASRSNPLPKSDELPRTSTQSAEIPKENPFLLSRSGLPHRTSPYGTGAPVQLADDVARRVIEKVFAESGIELKPGPYAEHGLSFHVDGYDPKTKLGFVFGSYKTLDEDAIPNWARSEERARPRALAPNASSDEWFEASWNRAIERMNALPKEKKRDIEKRYLKYLKRPQGKNVVTLGALSEEVDTIERELAAVDPEKLAYWEAQKLEKLSATKQAFIAVISSFDRRFEVDTYNERTQARFDTVSPLADAKELRAAYDKFFEEAAKEQIARLEDEVRRYIAWARSQGL